MSAYVLGRVLPPTALEFQRLVGELREAERPSYALAAISDLLVKLSPAELVSAVDAAELRDMPALSQNQLAAMVEHASHAADVRPPSWCGDVEPLASAWFAAPLTKLRAHLLRASPVAFRRRNLFVDSTVGDRV